MRTLPAIAWLSFLTALLLAATAAQAAPAAATSALHNWLDGQYEEELALSPETLTRLGRKERYDQLDDYSPAADARYLAWFRDSVDTMAERFDYEALDAEGRLSWDLWEWRLRRLEDALAFSDHAYVFTQISAPQVDLPQLMINYHAVDTRADMDAYLERLRSIGQALRQLLARAGDAAARGIRPPRFAYDIVIAQAREVISGHPFDDSDAPSALWADADDKLEALAQAGVISDAEADELRGDVAAALRGPLQEGYRAVIAWLEDDRANTGDTARGAHALPDGEAYYAQQLRYNTTTGLTAAAIHELGLAEVARIQGAMRDIMTTVAFEGTLEDFFRYVRDADRFYYPDTAAGRRAYMEETEHYLERIEARLPDLFGILPRMPLVVKRVEPFRERDGGAAFYQQGTPDGSRPGVYYMHLSDMRAMNRTDLQTTAYHEGNPGHHMQIAIAREREALPRFRRNEWYSAYGEGWALYAEQVAAELGLFEDPYYDFGRLNSELFRAIRLVVDTGLHSKGWSQERAVQYMLDNSAIPESKVRSEIRRYLVWPGQATSYKVGMLELLALREHARSALGDAFDQRGYHDLVLAGGALPLELLERRVEAWIAAETGGASDDHR
ncbi:MAG TPA: DUF885 domain-containing protein [Pseudohaliea sp.]|nr:DUF885 domain-containing protein [Pseudohaliea sp.]